LNNSFRKHILKEALEEMNEITLRKNKMKRRKMTERKAQVLLVVLL
jgi:hypothetical protein